MAFTAAGGALSMAAYGGPFGQDGAAEDVTAGVRNSSSEAVAAMVPAVAPVMPEADPAGDPVDVEALVKSVGLAEKRAQRTAFERCISNGSTFGGVRAAVAKVGNELRCRFDVDTVYGIAGRANASDHPDGLALDLMVGRASGERLAQYALDNRDRLGIEYVIYRQRIDTGDGWERMPDRGGATANHMDHVHISFEA